ncbi:hypothetical protein BCR42DRAFT_132456 [Absidia repens]|uniref:Cyclin-domain-containing protein n=1 Tax=Absidia repens TaxID=90262 RepID=A0A1X2IW75_9FUNG|nr:hypothetical protein BCR42DRAFT_132456 [Absidia repens]
MHLRVEATQPCALFPTKPTFVNPPAPSTLGYQPLSSTLPYPHQYYHQQQQQQGYSYSNGFGNNSNTVKRSSSAFEPLFYHQQQQQQQQVLPPSPPVTPSSMDRLPNLADFAASIVYLMWHARKPSLMATSKLSSPYRHSFSAVSGNASPAFKRFCLQVLTATQLSESAVFLALKYIANLLESNPSIEGAEGSEYRLFIVALMLANKFLDDNTFTNKTWSEVSGMKVQDLNIMESEFLEALEYSLFVREESYAQWKSVLETCRRQFTQQQHSLMMMSPAEQQHPLQRQEWITSTLYNLGLYKSSGEEKTLEPQQHQQQHDYLETDDDDDDDDDDDEVDDEEELFQMMHQQHTLRQQQDEQQRAMWSAAASATRVQLEQSQRQYQLYLMQQEQQQQQQQYRHHQSMTTPPLSLSSSSSTSALNRSSRSSVSSFGSRHATDATSSFALPTSRSTASVSRATPSYMQSTSGYGPSSSNRSSSSAYRSTCVPPGFQRRTSPWEPLGGTGGGGRCGDSFYSHQPFHPYQRQVTIVPPPSLRSQCPWGE